MWILKSDESQYVIVRVVTDFRLSRDPSEVNAVENRVILFNKSLFLTFYIPTGSRYELPLDLTQVVELTRP